MKSTSRLEVVLTDEQIEALDGRVDEFRAASYKVREKIARAFFRSFKSAYPQGVQFDDTALATVRTASAASCISHTFLAYSPAPVWEHQTGSEGICSENPKSDGWRKVRTPFTH
jgi:hypothetical protein